MNVKSDLLSISEIFALGMKKYGNLQDGFENWKGDLMKFVSEEFHDQLNSPNRQIQKQANDLASLWTSTTEISFFFRSTWGKKADNKSKALQYLRHAQLLERKYNDQYVIQIINHSIRTCLENKCACLE